MKELANISLNFYLSYVILLNIDFFL